MKEVSSQRVVVLIAILQIVSDLYLQGDVISTKQGRFELVQAILKARNQLHSSKQLSLRLQICPSQVFEE